MGMYIVPLWIQTITVYIVTCSEAYLDKQARIHCPEEGNN